MKWFARPAALPKRAAKVEAAMIGQAWGLATITAAQAGFPADFQPLSDMRASAAYRLTAAQNMLTRYFHDLAGSPVDVLAVRP